MRTGPGAPCHWCGASIPERGENGKRTRSDAATCSKPCRQAKHRFRIGPAPARAAEPMRFAYADPPYPGMSRTYYLDHPDYGGEVDHRELVRGVLARYEDGWALSTSTASLGEVLELCPRGVRVCAWVRGARHQAKSRRELNAWEPLIVYGGRQRLDAVAQDLVDVLLWGGRQHTHPGALTGMKPAAFCEWMFRLLGAVEGDQLDDLFPGSGAVTRAWTLFQAGGSSTRLPSRFAGAAARLEAAADSADDEDEQRDDAEDHEDVDKIHGGDHGRSVPASTGGTLAPPV